VDKERLYSEIVNNIRDGVYFVDTERRITFWNKAAEDITGYRKEEIIGKCCQSNLLNHIDKEGRELCLLGCPLYWTLADGKQRGGEVFLRHKNGHRVPVRVGTFPVTEDGAILGAIEIFTQSSPVVYDDVLVEELTNLAMNDQLTGLANRRKIESYIDFRLSEMKRFQNNFGVVFMDIDDFGEFNNRYGHGAGDAALKSVSMSVGSSVRKNDLFGRWGGEEFVGVFEVKNGSEAIRVAEKVRALIAGTEVRVGGGGVSVTASLGVTMAKEDDTVESVIKRADSLMYRSKRAGKNRVMAD